MFNFLDIFMDPTRPSSTRFFYHSKVNYIQFGGFCLSSNWNPLKGHSVSWRDMWWIEISFSVAGIFYHPQRSWGKVIFSEACVKNSVHGGGYLSMPCRSQGPHPGGSWGVWLGGVSRPTPSGGFQAHTRWVSQHALRQTPSPQQMATAAGGTLHTGMHSCCF